MFLDSAFEFKDGEFIAITEIGSRDDGKVIHYECPLCEEVVCYSFADAQKLLRGEDLLAKRERDAVRDLPGRSRQLLKECTHTPGPWSMSGNWYLTTSTGKMLTFQTVVGDNRKVAGVMMDIREIASPREMEANASLIVASPKLLEACKEMCEWLEFMFGSQFAREPAHRIAREAISEAEYTD